MSEWHKYLLYRITNKKDFQESILERNFDKLQSYMMRHSILQNLTIGDNQDYIIDIESTEEGGKWIVLYYDPSKMKRIDLVSLNSQIRDAVASIIKIGHREYNVGDLVSVFVKNIAGRKIIVYGKGIDGSIQPNSYNNDKFFVSMEYMVLIEDAKLNDGSFVYYFTRMGDKFISSLIFYYFPNINEFLEIKKVVRIENIVSYIVYNPLVDFSMEEVISYQKLKNLINEIQGEKIFFLKYEEREDAMVRSYYNSLDTKYAFDIKVDDDKKELHLSSENPGFFIGKGGIHVKVLSKMLNYKIIIETLSLEDDE